MTRLDSCLAVHEGELYMESRQVSELADRFGTPLYVVSEDQIRRNVMSFRSSFEAHWPHGPVRVLPAIKANPVTAIAQILADEGVGADCFGMNELALVLQAGIPAELTSLNGSLKSAEAILLAIEHGVRITLDSRREIALVRDSAQRLGRQANVRIRVRPDFVDIEAPTEMRSEAYPSGLAAKRYRMGMSTADVLASGDELLGADELNFTGVHMHIGRHRGDLEWWQHVLAAYTHVLGELSSAWGGWEPREIDIGGGFATPRDPVGCGYAHRSGLLQSQSPTINEYARALTGALSGGLRRCGIDVDGKVLEIEPGRAIFGDAGIHVARVINIKRERQSGTTKCWVETDTSEIFLDGVNRGERFLPLLASEPQVPLDGSADVTGTSCNSDMIVPDAELSGVEVGSVIAFLDTGCYQEASSSNFNLLPRPATVLVCGGDAQIIRRRETLQDVLARDRALGRLARGPACPSQAPSDNRS